MKVATLASGSSGNATFLGSDKKGILIDCGLSGKKAVNALEKINIEPENLEAIVVTHEHRDHVVGVGIMSRKYDLPVYATEKTWHAMGADIGKIAEKNQHYLSADSAVEIGELQLEIFSTSHDAVDPIGLSGHCNGKKVGIATDTGCITEGMNKNLDGSDIFLLESNHNEEMLMKGPYPYYLKKRVKSNEGHLANETAGRALSKWVNGDTQQIVLAHLSQENNSPYLARKTVEDILRTEKINVGLDVQVTVAPREENHPLVEIIEENNLKAV